MTLLEDDPFASIFLVHKHLNPARGRRREDWIKELAQEVNTNPTVSEVAIVPFVR